MKKQIILILFLLLCNASPAQIVINEIMQSNVDCIMDDLNEFPDSWVELYNDGSNNVNLDEYKIGITKDVSTAWQLPSVRMSPDSYYVIYCDKMGAGKHTDFHLESSKGCELYLFRNGEIVDKLPSEMKKQPAPNIAYGRKTDGIAEWGYQLAPTPGYCNCGQIVSGDHILGDPIFSIPGKVTTNYNILSLDLSIPQNMPQGTVIRYTTDCTEPTENSTQFTDPILIYETTIVRAKLFCQGYLSPRSVTQSYIFFPRKVSLPVVSIATDIRYFKDRSIGIYAGYKYDDGIYNYNHDWRRPANFEFFENKDSRSQLNQLLELRVCGGKTRSYELKSLALYANKRFGEKRLEYEFFPEQRPGITSYKSIMMRNAGNDFYYLYLRDALIQRHIASHVDVDFQAWCPTIFMLNGEYRGILSIRERSNEDNIYANYDKLEDVDMIEYYGDLKEGTLDNWKKFKSFYTEKGHTWKEYEQYLDINEYLNVMIANIFYCNTDFPGNNVLWWRSREKEGRWRLFMKDVDYGLGLYRRDSDFDYFTWLHEPNAYDWANLPDATLLFRRLESDATFKRELIDRFAIYMGDFLNFESLWDLWEQMSTLISYELEYHRDYYNIRYSYAEEKEFAKKWMQKRVNSVYSQLRDYYKLGSIVPLYINRSFGETELENISTYFNNVKLSQNTFSGKFFEGRDVTLYAENIKGWSVSQISYSGISETKFISGETYSFKMPDCFSMTINAVLPESTDIGEVDINVETKVFDIYDMFGNKRERIEDGINILVYKDGSNKIIMK